MDGILEGLRKELVKNADERVKESEQRFFKEKVLAYGLKNATVWKISKEYFVKVKSLSRDQIYSLCEELLGSGYLEESFVACGWSYGIRAKYEGGDLARFERWIERYVNNWATCDTLCNHTVGAFIQKYPKRVGVLKKWARSKNMWMRRAAAVSLVVPAKSGKFLEEAFQISDALMEDDEDLVQKGFGWLLKEESRTHQKEVFDYLMENRGRMPRTALRYALERMPKELRAEAMEK